MNILSFLKKILNEAVTIELKNGVIIYGLLTRFDKSMNLYLKNVKKSVNQEKFFSFESICIRGSTIRYIIIPDWVNLDLILIENM